MELLQQITILANPLDMALFFMKTTHFYFHKMCKKKNNDNFFIEQIDVTVDRESMRRMVISRNFFRGRFIFAILDDEHGFVEATRLV